MASDPVSAGRKGGAAGTPAQNAARRRNGFQKVYKTEQQETAPITAPEKTVQQPAHKSE